MLMRMRRPLHPPTELPSAEEVATIRAYFDGQSRIDLAVWVRHEHQGVDGPVYDHHLMLGLKDADYESAHPDAILFGVEREAGRLGGWADLFPLSEVEKLREFGYVAWERDGRPIENLDPLNFRYSFEAIEAPPGLAALINAAVEDVPAVVGVELTHERLWKDDREVWAQARVFVIEDEARGRVGDAVTTVDEVVAPFFPLNRGVSLGRSHDPRVETTTLFNRAGERIP
jgi:hypothetical protein